ncbi:MULTISPECIES: hypothetical protein [Tenebrionibacter/Tenebrionicola group]|jgi:hypothetical protein|uniref:DUF4177 domain-containing protein n=2 Tax=Tenebrionibacter/Tenebrionicola group TaxID=2969848 RepID=A0A8K0V8B8_9ENTR|nr:MULTISPECIES: hypothetical protein [Tenebrionibacter/Tenebrionicola group]MBK4716112.1 hypothetical protein [Tenebrionibacter intestinalis]MBV5095959.1 hypothetical protein [Tenebrionicola larvae]
MNKRIALASLAFCLSASAIAGEAYVCRSKPQPITSGQSLSNKTIFVCSDSLQGTLPQLAKEGWQIVQVFQQTDENDDAPTPEIYHELIVQKP